LRPDTGPYLALASFRGPIPLPVQDLDGLPSRTITVPCSYLPMMRGALLQLVLQYTWPQDDPAAVLLAQQRAMTLIAALEECEGTIPPIACPYDFEFSDAGWGAVSPYTIAGYSPGNGFASQFFDGEDKSFVFINHFLTGVNTITHIEVTYSAEADGSGANNQITLQVNNGIGLVPVVTTTVFEGTHVIGWTGSLDNVTEIRFDLDAGSSDNLILVTSARYDGLSNNGCG